MLFLEKIMGRKLYALFVLIWAIGALILIYLYFFVYYTAVFEVHSNIPNYKLSFFSSSTAQKRVENCEEEKCTISDLAPFEYNITFSSEWYKTQHIKLKISPRSKQEYNIEFQKEVTLSPVKNEVQEKEISAKEKIEKIREEKKYYKIIQLTEEEKIYFSASSGLIEGSYNGLTFWKFPKIWRSSIEVESIFGSDDIFLRYGEKKYILFSSDSHLQELNFDQNILYIKMWPIRGQYIIVTEKGVFLYNLQENTYEFMYGFSDLSYSWADIIWVISDDAKSLKKNYNFTETWNLIIKYTPKTKERTVLYSSSKPIDRIYLQETQIFVEIEKMKYKLENY